MTLERYRPVIDDWDAFVEAARRPEPTVFRVRTGRVAEETLLERLKGRGFRTRPVDGLPSFHQVEDEPGPVTLTPEHWQGLIYVQQASTGVAAPALAPRPGDRVLDLCAAPGGKTLHMSELMEDRGCVVANEVSEGRIRGLLGNVYRLGHTGIMVVAADGRSFPDGPLFDRVLVDAPCTGEGTLRRRGGHPPQPSESFVAHIGRVQRALLDRAVALTRPGGSILYVTCTFAPEENEAVVSDVLRNRPVTLEPLDLPVAHAPGLTRFEADRYDERLVGAARIYPHHLDSGGLFLARLRRLADPSIDPARWAPVPEVFPHVGGEGGSDDPERDRALLRSGLDEIQERFGVAHDLRGSGWIMRGGRAWMHTLDQWPLPGWAPGAWRPISVGIRSIDFDSKDRARPSNDLLRILDGEVTRRVVDVGDEALDALLRREPVTTEIEDRGPYALRHQGEVVGRGAVTRDGLKSEIPKARAADLRRIRENPYGV